MKIYMVQGSAGEYEDYRTWLVKAFVSEKSAQDYSQKCAAEFRRIETEAKEKGTFFYDWEYEKYNISPNIYDPKMDMGYSGAQYDVVECELIEEINNG